MRVSFQARALYMIPLIGVSTAVLIACIAGSVYAIARGYTTDDAGLQTGMVAALSTDKAPDSKIERASQDSSQRVVGIVTTFENSSVTVASSNTKVLVESEGEVEAYVSDMSGSIKQGDLLTLSPLKGILMRTTDKSQSSIIALAAEDTSASTDGSSYTIEENGSNRDVQIYKLKVNLNRQGAVSNGGQAADSALSKLGRAVVGRDVGEARVVVALIIFIVVLIAEGGIIYGAVASAITALGRNPLARKIIRQEMTRVILVAIGVLLVGLGAVYAVLWV